MAKFETQEAEELLTIDLVSDLPLGPAKLNCSFEGTLNEALFLLFLETMVYPSLVGHGPRVLMWDNRSSHLTAAVRGSGFRSGHRSVNRPAHSPDFAPIEWCFGEMDAHLRAREGLHTIDTNVTSIGDAAADVKLSNIRQYFFRAHYTMPGLLTMDVNKIKFHIKAKKNDLLYFV